MATFNEPLYRLHVDEFNNYFFSIPINEHSEFALVQYAAITGVFIGFVSSTWMPVNKIMQIKSMMLLLACLFGALFFVYREGYDKGFTTAIGQIQIQNAKHVDMVIKKANDIAMNDEKVMDKFIAKQAQFIKSVEVVSEPVRIDKKPRKAVAVIAKENDKHETNNVVRVVGIDDDDELYELQRLTRAANAH